MKEDASLPISFWQLDHAQARYLAEVVGATLEFRKHEREEIRELIKAIGDVLDDK